MASLEVKDLGIKIIMRKTVFLLGELSPNLFTNLSSNLQQVGWSLAKAAELTYADQAKPTCFLAICVAGNLIELQEQLAKLRQQQLACFLVVAASSAPDLFLNASRLGARDVLSLASAQTQLVDKVLGLIEQLEEQSLNQKNQNLVQSQEATFHLTGAMNKILRHAGIAARHDLNLLITGETGTGKEDTARRIHRSSARAAGPFIPINCSALPDELFEAELFGHSEGAYTGAGKSRAGLIETAAGGSLLLDEIGDLPLSLQPKLLHFLETKTFTRVGETKRLQADVRIFAATHKNLPQLINEGLFRADLYFRLNQASLHLPPLRERKEDLADLMHGFIQEFNQELLLDVVGYAPQVLSQAKSYCWPGNIRELRNQLRLAVLAVRSGPVLNLPFAINKAQA